MGNRRPEPRLTAPDWSQIEPATPLTIVKLAPDGAEAARYPGLTVGSIEPGRWRVISAIWTYRHMTLDGLDFIPGDQLIELFSPEYYFNAFAILSPVGTFRGWYANVSKPAYLRSESSGIGALELVWHDLFLDLVGLPGGSFIIRDREELEASGLESRDADVYQEIVAASHDLTRRFENGDLPFLSPEQLREYARFGTQAEN